MADFGSFTYKSFLPATPDFYPLQKVNESKPKILDKYHLDNVDQLLLKQMVEFPESSLRELASVVNYSVPGVRNRLLKPAFKKALSELQQTTEESLRGLAHYAIKKLKHLMDSDDERVSLDACKTVWTAYQNISDSNANMTRISYEVQFGTQGQLFKNIKAEEQKHESLISTKDLIPND